MSVDSEHSTESTVTINSFIYSTHHYWMGPIVESEIVTGIERALLGGILELELMFCWWLWWPVNKHTAPRWMHIYMLGTLCPGQWLRSVYGHENRLGTRSDGCSERFRIRWQKDGPWGLERMMRPAMGGRVQRGGWLLWEKKKAGTLWWPE